MPAEMLNKSEAMSIHDTNPIPPNSLGCVSLQLTASNIISNSPTQLRVTNKDGVPLLEHLQSLQNASLMDTVRLSIPRVNSVSDDPLVDAFVVISFIILL